MVAHIAGYLHAAAAAAATDGGSSGTALAASPSTDPPLFLCEGRATTAAQASSRVTALAAALTQRLGMQVRVWLPGSGRLVDTKPCSLLAYHLHKLPLRLLNLSPHCIQQVGDRVCLAALATDANLEALLAITAAGGVAAPLNWRWDIAEASGAARLVGARLLLADAACLRFALALMAARRGAITTLVLLGLPGAYSQADLAAAPAGLTVAFAEALIQGCPGASLDLRSAPGGAALIVYTSGGWAGGRVE